jgi:hypothetical protein
MREIELVIKISEEDYERLKVFKKAPFCSFPSRIYEAIAHGTPLPEHHGDLKDVSALETISVWESGRFEAVLKEDIDEAPTIIPATKEVEPECDWLDCKYNDGVKCHNNSTVLGESCYEPSTKEGDGE